MTVIHITIDIRLNDSINAICEKKVFFLSKKKSMLERVFLLYKFK